MFRLANIGSSFDLAMLEIQNAKERDVQDWKKLFETAHENFVFESVRVPLGSKLAIIEASWKGD